MSKNLESSDKIVNQPTIEGVFFFLFINKFHFQLIKYLILNRN